MLCCKLIGESDGEKDLENHLRINGVTAIGLISPFLKHRVVLVSDVILFYICPPFSAAIMLVTAKSLFL